MKRAFDVATSTFLVVTLLPFLLLIAILIKVDSPGPVFYRGPRIGKDGKIFHIYKFRTMVVNAQDLGPGITIDADPRITRVGRTLRKLKIDEIPQLINVIKGEMSIVGPRPEDPRYVEHYTSRQREVLTVLPGITSPASLLYRHEERLLNREGWEEHYFKEILPSKLSMEIDYIKRRSFRSDLKLIFKTIIAIFS